MIVRTLFIRLMLAGLLVNLPGCGSGGSDDSSPGQDDGEPELPVVDLGTDRILYNDQPLTLSATVSGDGPFTYQWQQVSGSAATIGDIDAAATQVTYQPRTETEELSFRLTATNAAGSHSDTVNVTLQDRIYEAARIGNPALLPGDVSELEQRILDRISTEQAAVAALHEEVFGDDSVVYDPGRSSRFFSLLSFTSAREVVIGNDGLTFMAASENAGQRTLAVGSNIIVETAGGSHGAFEPQLVKLLNWLLTPLSLEASGDNIRVALMLMSNSHMNTTENWLQAQNENVTLVRCTDEPALTACLADADLIITGASAVMAEASVTAALDQAASNQQALLYTHNDSWNSTALTNPVLTYFGVQTQSPGSAGNFFSRDAANWDSAASMRDASGSLGAIAGLVSRFQNNTFSFSIADCNDGDSDCGTVPAFASEFLDSAETLRDRVKTYDESGTDIFSDATGYPLEKLLILLADQYRQGVSFPMSKTSTDTRAYLKSYFADHLVYNNRQYNPMQADLGNFSRTDFSHITPLNKTVAITSRERFRAAGVYALPGQTFTVTRTDSNTSVNASVYVNSLRSSSTQQMAPANGYNRPKFLQSHHVPVAAGATIELTSPYGGPVQIEFEDAGTEMSFEFTGVGQHPFWKTGDGNTAFLAALAADQYDWAEVAAEHFELHQTVEKMQSTLSDSRWDTPAELETYITRYHHNYHKVLSGYQGENIDVIAEIHNFATANDYVVPVYADVQHFNGDQPTCGYGCSGNPYDAAWPFSALGHGDLHEVGHNFESGRFKFNGFEGHATTNFYSYYVKSRAFAEEGIAHNCQSLPFDAILTDIQASQLQADPAAYMATLGYSGWNYGVALVIEMMMHAEENGTLQNGWHLVPRLHLLERAFETADNNDTDWDAAKASLGFASYNRSEALAIDNNDWLLIAASYSAALDYRPFMDLLGLTYSTKASAQVAALGYPAVENAFYTPASNNGYCASLTGHGKTSF